MQEGAAILENWKKCLTSKFQTQILKELDNQSGQNLKYKLFSGGLNDGNNEEPGWPGIAKKKSEGNGSSAHGHRNFKLKY